MRAGEAPLTSLWGNEVRGEEPLGITAPDRAAQGCWLRVFSYLGPGPLDKCQPGLPGPDSAFSPAPLSPLLAHWGSWEC